MSRVRRLGRRFRGCCGCRLGLGPGRRLRFRLRRRGGLPCAGPDRLDLDLGQAAAEACVLPVAGPPLVLADADLVAQHMADDPRGDRRRGRQIGVAVAADEQDAGAERLPLVGLQPIDE